MAMCHLALNSKHEIGVFRREGTPQTQERPLTGNGLEFRTAFESERPLSHNCP